MEISPETEDTIKNFLSLLMNGDDIATFSNLDHAITIVKEAQPCWQAPASIGVHAAVFHLAETDAEATLLQDLIGRALAPLETLLESLAPKAGEKALGEERAHLLFHSRFGLGFLLLASGDEERAKTVLHQMAATRLPMRGVEVRAGPGIIRLTRDITRGKLLAALFMQGVYKRKEDYGEALYLITEAVACNPLSPVLPALTEQAPALLDHWAERCEEEDASTEYDSPTLGWLDLFAEAAEILSVCQEADSSGALPNECKGEAAQFLAWKFGQIAGEFATHGRWRDGPFGASTQFIREDWRVIGEEFNLLREGEKVSRALNVVAALLCEYEPNRVWEKIREHYILMWNTSYTYQGTSLSELTPESDLYWAMRIGFADKMLEAQQHRIIGAPVSILPTIHSIEGVKDILSAIALRELKLQQSLDEIIERQPSSKREIGQFLEQQLNSIWVELPAKVIDTLVKAESYYKTEVNNDDAKVYFAKAVEAALNHRFVTPLIDYMQKRCWKQIEVCFLQGRETRSGEALHKLSLLEWAEIFGIISTPRVKGLADLAMPQLLEFMKQHYRWQRLPDLHPLAQSLQRIQTYRGGSAHYQEASSRYEREVWKLEEMRKLVLGIGQTSVIGQIFKVFAPQAMPDSNLHG